MSMNENKNTEKACDHSIKQDLAAAACNAVDAVLTSIAGAKLYQKVALKVSKSAVDPLKLKKASGILGMGICSGILMSGDFVPTLAQALDRAWAKRDAKNAPAEAVAEEPLTEEVAPAEDVTVEEAPAEETVAEETVAEDIVAEDVVEEAPACEKPAEEAETVPAMAASEEQDEDEEDESYGFSTAGLEFFDVMEKPEEYAALVEQENAGEIMIVTRYRRSFLSRLIQSQGEVQAYYSAIKNKLLSYKGVKGRVSWGNESFNKGRTYIAKVSAKSRTLYLYLAIDPATLEESKYSFEDVSSKKKYENVPVLIKIKGSRKLAYALELIDSICNGQLALPEVKNFEEVNYVVEYRSTEDLVQEGLIKKLVAAVPAPAFDTTVPPTETEVDVTVASV